jgi:hypothetical protein
MHNNLPISVADDITVLFEGVPKHQNSTLCTDNNAIKPNKTKLSFRKRKQNYKAGTMFLRYCQKWDHIHNRATDWLGNVGVGDELK